MDSFYEKLLFKDLSTLTIEDGEWQEFSIVTSRSKKIIRIPLYAPKIIIHVGVSGQARCMLLESRAFNSADVLDIAGRVPINNKIIQSLDKDFCEKCSLGIL